MIRIKNRWIGLGTTALLGMLLLLSGCTPAKTATATDPGGSQPAAATTTLNPATISAAQAALKFYDSVSLDEPRAQLEARLAVPGEVQPDGQVAYRDPISGYGVLVAYGEEDTVFAKQLIPAARALELAALNPAPVTDRQAYRIAAGMPFYEVQDIMGSDGIEVSLSKPLPGSPKQVYGLGWFNPDGSLAIVYLNVPKGDVIASEFRPAGP